MRLCQHATGSLYFQLQLQLIVNVQIFAKKKCSRWCRHQSFHGLPCGLMSFRIANSLLLLHVFAVHLWLAVFGGPDLSWNGSGSQMKGLQQSDASRIIAMERIPLIPMDIS